MTFDRLVWRNIAWHPIRSGLLLFFAALSVFLFVFLRSVLTTLDQAIHSAASDRLTVQSGVGPLAELPSSYRDALTQVKGVDFLCRFSWFGGIFRDPSNTFPTVAVDVDAMLRAYPEVVVPPDQRLAILAERRGCILGRRIAERFGLRLGDTVPMQGTLYPLPDGKPWEFVVSAIYRSEDPAFPETLVLFHWAYLEEVRRTLPTSAEVGSLVTMYLVKVAKGYAAADVAARIDALYAGGPQRTHTQTEQAHRADEIAMLGEIPAYLSLVGSTVLVAMLIACINAMGIAAGERARTVGLLKALGFPDRSAARLVIVESLYVVGGGGLLGTTAAFASQGAWRWLLGESLSTYRVEPATVALGAAVSLAMGLLGGLPPAIRLARVQPLAVLRQEG